MVGVQFADATGTSRFTTFTLTPVDKAVLQRVAGRASDDGRPITLSFTGPGLLGDRLTKLREVEAVALVNGRPWRTSSLTDYWVGVCRTGELVALTFSVYERDDADGENDRTANGVIVNVTPSAGPGFARQSLDLTFYPCNKLHVRASNEILEVL